MNPKTKDPEDGNPNAGAENGKDGVAGEGGSSGLRPEDE